MKVKGNYVLNASAQTIWKLLMNPEVLERITPGISELETLEEDRFKAISNIKIGPVKAGFEGELALREKVENESTQVVLDQKSKIGNAVATIDIKLNAQDNGHTEITYEGNAKMTGRLATMGQRIVGGVVKTLSKQFFKSLEKEIES
ncbi:MAG: carbon monoxide dehydrogenase subunit G [Bacteroidota bacterium]